MLYFSRVGKNTLNIYFSRISKFDFKSLNKMAGILCEKATMINLSIFHFQFSQPQKPHVSIAFFGEQFYFYPYYKQ